MRSGVERLPDTFSPLVVCNCSLCRNRANQTESSDDLFNCGGWLFCVECGNRRQERDTLVLAGLCSV